MATTMIERTSGHSVFGSLRRSSVSAIQSIEP